MNAVVNVSEEVIKICVLTRSVICRVKEADIAKWRGYSDGF